MSFKSAFNSLQKHLIESGMNLKKLLTNIAPFFKPKKNTI